VQPLITFQNSIGYAFNDLSLLQQALTHKSYAYEKSEPLQNKVHNERFEFLGDAVLELAVSTLLMRDEGASEGDLSKRRASLVNEKTLAQVARDLGVSQYLFIGKGESKAQGHNKDSILASAFEAIIGAIYLDGGFDLVFKMIESHFAKFLTHQYAVKLSDGDYKTKLQEVWQARTRLAPTYKLEKSEGPDHEKTFFVSVFVGETKLAEGVGRSRKEAEQKAAAKAFEGDSHV